MPAKYKYHFSNTTEGDLTITDEPLNWESLTITFKRSKVFEGVNKNFSQDLIFWGDANTYLRSVYNREGINSQVGVVVEIFDLVTYAYETLFEGRVNFSNYTEELTDDGLTIVNTNIESSLFEQQVEKGASIDVDVFKLEDRFGDPITPFANYERIEVDLSGQKLTDNFESLQSPTLNNSFFGVGSSSDDREKQEFYFQFELTDDSKSVIKINNPDTYIGRAVPQELFTFENSGRTTISVELSFDLKMILSSGNFDAVDSQVVSLLVISKNLGILSKESFPRPRTSATTFVESFTFSSFNERFFTAPDEISVYCLFEQYSDPSAVMYSQFEFDITNYTLNVNTITDFPKTLYKGMFPFELFSRVVNILTGERNRVIGDIISRTNQAFNPAVSDGIASKVSIGSGRNIRGFPEDESPLVVNLKQLFESFKYGFNIGLGFLDFNGKETIIVDDIDTFYTDTVILTINDAVKNPRMTLDPDGHWTNLKFGFSKYKIEDRNFQNTQEFNTQRFYNSAVQVVDKSEEILSPYIGAGFGLEYQRRKPWFPETTDQRPDESRFDDDKFLLCLTDNDGADSVSEGQMNFTDDFVSFIDFDWVGPGEWQNTYYYKDFNADQNEILYENGLTGFEAVPSSIITERNPIATLGPLVFMQLGGWLRTPPQSISYNADINVSGRFNISEGGLDVNALSFLLERIDADGTNPSSRASVEWKPSADSENYTLNLSDLGVTVLPTDPDRYYRVQMLFQPGASTGFVNLNFFFQSFDFSLSIDEKFQQYRQENALDYFGSGVTVSNLVNSDSSLNFRISPRQAMERHVKTLGAVNYRLAPNQLTFSGDPIGNVLVSTTNPTFAENDDIDTNVEHTYENEYFEFDTEWTLAKSKLVDANRYGLIVVDTDDVQFTGFVDEIVFEVENNKATVKLKRKGSLPVVALPLTPTLDSVLQESGFESSALRLTWTPDLTNPIDDFIIERQQLSPVVVAWADVDTIGGGFTSYLDEGLDSNSTYSYRLRAQNVTGDSSDSNEITTGTSAERLTVTTLWNDATASDGAFSIAVVSASSAFDWYVGGVLHTSGSATLSIAADEGALTGIPTEIRLEGDLSLVTEVSWPSKELIGPMPNFILFTAIETIDLSGNNLNNPSVLDLSSLTALTIFNLGDNALTLIPTLPTSIISILLGGNAIGSIPDLAGYTSLVFLELQDNTSDAWTVTTLSATIKSVDISGNSILVGGINDSLVALDVAGGGSGPGFSYDSSGGLNAAPTGAGATAVTSLQGKSWTVTTN